MKRLGIVGVGNCACAFVQALSAIRRGEYIHQSLIPGLEDVNPAAFEMSVAFDVDARKVGRLWMVTRESVARFSERVAHDGGRHREGQVARAGQR